MRPVSTRCAILARSVERSKSVAQIVRLYHPLSKKLFYDLQEKLPTVEEPILVASLFYVLNRASFSGSTNSGGMSPNHPRFNQASIDRLREFSAPNVEVHHSDAFVFLKGLMGQNPSGKVIYLDPPYMIKNNLYGNKGDMHRRLRP